MLHYPSQRWPGFILEFMYKDGRGETMYYHCKACRAKKWNDRTRPHPHRYCERMTHSVKVFIRIGYAVARRLGLDGAKVVISSRKQANVDEAAESLREEGVVAEGIVCHVGRSEDRQSLVDKVMKIRNTVVEKFGGLDILVSNAGINPHFGSLLDLFDVNVKSGFLLSKLVVPHMEKQGGGNIVFVSSVTGYTPFQGIAAYGITKTALLGLTKALSITLASRNIRVNAIAPGIIKTDFSRALWDNPSRESEAYLDQMIPMGRLGKPEDCAAAVSFLCSEGASYITGETILMSGGINARL